MKRPAQPKQTDSRRARLWLFRILALFLVPLVLVALELALRISGFGHDAAFFKAEVIGGKACLVENDQFGLSFFPPELARSPTPLVMAATKPPGRYRIFLLGESAALGDPAPAFGVGRYLQALLRERYPAGDFEVVCVAMTAINSHSILPIARECARQDGDLWVIYMGNNEMVGPFGAATVFGAKAPSASLVRLKLALEKSRLVQWVESLIRRWGGSASGQNWEGMKLFLNNRLAADDPVREAVYRNFQANLQAVLNAGERAGIPVVLSTVAVNLRDFAPLASLPLRAAGTNLPVGLLDAIRAGDTARAAQDWPTALRAYTSASELSPHYAEAEYRLAQCQLALSNLPAARIGFAQARDNDALPFRTDSRLNAILSQAAQARADRGVTFFDAEAELAVVSSTGIPGAESFYEHVHFNFDGNYRLARAWAETLVARLPAVVTRSDLGKWPTQEQCERDLGLTDWNRAAVLDDVVRRLTQPPFSGQPDHALYLARWQAQLNEVRKRLTPTNAVAARSVYREALQQQPDDFRLQSNFAEFLEQTGDLPGAIDAWQKVGALMPHHHLGYYQTGRLLAAQGRSAEARQQLDLALKLRPDLAAGWYELGRLSLAEGKTEEALADFARAHQLVPQDPRTPFQAARVLSQLKRSEEAIQQAREALRWDPQYWEARSFLGEELAFAGRIAEAQKEFEMVLQQQPNYPWAHLNLGVALFKQGRREEAVQHFETALRLDPKLEPARQYLQQLKP